MKKLLLLAGILVLGAVTFAAAGQGALQGNRQPNGQTKMEANGGICTVTGTTTRANAGNSNGTGVRLMNGTGKNSGKGQGRHRVATTTPVTTTPVQAN